MIANGLECLNLQIHIYKFSIVSKLNFFVDTVSKTLLSKER